MSPALVNGHQRQPFTMRECLKRLSLQWSCTPLTNHWRDVHSKHRRLGAPANCHQMCCMERWGCFCMCNACLELSVLTVPTFIHTVYSTSSLYMCHDLRVVMHNVQTEYAYVRMYENATVLAGCASVCSCCLHHNLQLLRTRTSRLVHTAWCDGRYTSLLAVPAHKHLPADGIEAAATIHFRLASICNVLVAR